MNCFKSNHEINTKPDKENDNLNISFVHFYKKSSACNGYTMYTADDTVNKV